MDIRKIIELCKDGDRKAQFELYDAFVIMVSIVCERYSLDLPTAKDNVQVIFIKAFTNLHQFDETKSQFQTWLKRIAINHCLKEYRKNKNILFTPDFAAIKDDGEWQEYEFEDTDEHLMATIDTLPDGYRTVFLLSVVDELSHKEIAEQLGISENTSRSQLYKAKKMLRDKLTNWHKVTKAI